MSMALARSLIKEKGWNKEKVIIAYQEWAQGEVGFPRPFGMGKKPNYSFGQIRQSKDTVIMQKGRLLIK